MNNDLFYFKTLEMISIIVVSKLDFFANYFKLNSLQNSSLFILVPQKTKMYYFLITV